MKSWYCSEHFAKITIPLHILALLGMTSFEQTVTGTHIIAFAIGWILISGVGIAVGYHRYFSHQSFKTYKYCEPLLAFLGCLGAQGSPIFWVGLHMGLHHPYSDKEQDLHSPQSGFLNAYFGWQIKLESHSAPLKPAARFFCVKYMRFLHKHYYKIFWLTIVIIYFILPNYWLFALVLPMLASLHQENIINSTCHLRHLGYRNFDTTDESVNNPIWGLLFFGQGWHNNHHAYPRRAYYGFKWFEIDPSWIIIKLIEKRDKKIRSIPGKPTLPAIVFLATVFLTTLFATVSLYGSDDLSLKQKFAEVDQKIYLIIDSKSEASLSALIDEREALCSQNESLCLDMSKWIDNILAYNAKNLLDQSSRLILSAIKFTKSKESINSIYQQIIDAVGKKVTPTKELMIIELLLKDSKNQTQAKETLLKWYIQTQQNNIKLLVTNKKNNAGTLNKVTKNFQFTLDKIKEQKPIHYELLEYAYDVTWNSIVDEGMLNIHTAELKSFINEIFFQNIKYKYIIGKRSQVIFVYETFLKNKSILSTSVKKNELLEYVCTSYRYTAQDKKCLDLLTSIGYKKLPDTLKIEYALTIYKMGSLEEAYNYLEKMKSDKSISSSAPWINYYLSHILYSKKEYLKAEEHLKLFMADTSIQYPLKSVTEAIIFIKICAQQKRFSEAHKAFENATQQLQQEVTGSFYDLHLLNFSYLILLIKENNLKEIKKFIVTMSNSPFARDSASTFYKIIIETVQSKLSKQNTDNLIKQISDNRGRSNPETLDFLEALKMIN